MKVTLNEAQIESLGQDLLHPEVKDKDPDEVEIDVVQAFGKAQLRMDGAYLHTDGDWATYPDGADPETYRQEIAFFMEPKSPVVWEYRFEGGGPTMIGRAGQFWCQVAREEGEWVIYLKDATSSDQFGSDVRADAMDAVAIGEYWLREKVA
jgi:hypothetical protein